MKVYFVSPSNCMKFDPIVTASLDKVFNYVKAYYMEEYNEPESYAEERAGQIVEHFTNFDEVDSPIWDDILIRVELAEFVD